MRKKLFNALKYIGFLAIGVFLFWLVYRDMDMSELKKELWGLNYGWLIISFFINMLSHISRAYRWNMLIKPLGHKPRVVNSFLAVMVMYLTNLALPRAGEIARCSILSKYEKVPFSKLVGTVVTERITDMVALIFFAIIILLMQYGVFKEFLETNPVSHDKFTSLFSFKNILIVLFFIVLFAIIFIVFRKPFKKTKIYQRILGIFQSFTEGFKTIFKLKHKWHYIGHTIFIYVIWFLALYLIFFSYKPTEHLSILAAAVALVMGGLAMIAPVQGGIGPWHFMVMETLFIYGIDRTQGKIFALIAHTANNLSLMIVGAIALVILPVINKSRQPGEQ